MTSQEEKSPPTRIAAILDRLTPEARTALAAVERDLAAKGPSHLDVVFPSLPRKIGRGALGGGKTEVGKDIVDFDALRLCDAAAAVIIARLPEDARRAAAERLYSNGDFEEKRMVQKSLAFVELGGAAAPLLEQAHRTNDQIIFESAFVDSTFAASVLDREQLRRVVLKAAFMDLDASRFIDLARFADAELSRMLLEFMSEREAAGRLVWFGSLETAAHAPSPGVEARILGDLWHGDDRRRAAAARAAAIHSGPRILEEVRIRAQREMHPKIRAILESILAKR